jgi:hypothetical protein
MDNTSGQGATAIVPAELRGWNWGAFLMHWIWGIGNNTLIALLMFVPMVNLVMPFVLGAKGNSWAWQNKRWESVTEFKSTQRKWAIWGVALYLLIVALLVATFFGIAASIKSSEPFKLAIAQLEASEEATQFLGKPISTGFPSGSIEVSGPTGSASLSFGVHGPKGRGTLYLEASKKLGRWRLDQVVLEDESTARRLDLTP